MLEKFPDVLLCTVQVLESKLSFQMWFLQKYRFVFSRTWGFKNSKISMFHIACNILKTIPSLMSVVTSKYQGGEILEFLWSTDLCLNTKNWKISLEPCLRKCKRPHKSPKKGCLSHFWKLTIVSFTIVCSDTIRIVRKIFRAPLMLQPWVMD